MILPTLSQLEIAQSAVYRHLNPTAQINWPLLSQRCGCEVWVKHENHNPTGAFKVRGGLVYLDHLVAEQADIPGVIAATRGNHGQSVAYAASHFGVSATLVVPEGNSEGKNRAMEAYGARLIVHGSDFDQALEYAQLLAHEEQLHMLPSFHPHLVAGVASYGLELLTAQPTLDRLYVPIGLGSGIVASICARNALGLDTEIVGVVANEAPAYLNSMRAGTVIASESANTLADGLAVRTPNQEALDVILENVSRIVGVSERQIMEAIRVYFSDTHNLAEGAGAAPLAALMQAEDIQPDMKVGLVLTGGNIDSALFQQALEDQSGC